MAQQGSSRRRERAHRILDAAATLILRWGYNKTTIDDIAKEARVAKGTIYLHWKTREDLFTALMLRERMELSRDFAQRITADPESATLSRILKHSALALLQRPLLKAVLVRDLDVLGKLAHTASNTEALMERLAGFNLYLDFLRNYGLVRDDLNPRAQTYIVSAVFMGFFLVAPLMPDGLVLDEHELAELIGETIHRTLEPEHHAASQAGIVSEHFARYLDHAVRQSEALFDQALDGSV